MTSGSPSPDEPHLRSEPRLLSPTSPKPIHFPTPANIPVLDRMMDGGFNQLETHMNDPAMHDTVPRPGAWQDPSVSKDDGAAEASPPADGHDSASVDDEDLYATADPGLASTADTTNSVAPETAADVANPTLTNTFSTSAQPDAAADVVDPVAAQALPLSTPSVPTAAQPQTNDVQNEQATVAALPNNVDLQAIIRSLQPSPNSSVPQNQLPPPGADQSPLSVQALGAPPLGLPPRPPPQHPDYANPQNIKDFHPQGVNANQGIPQCDGTVNSPTAPPNLSADDAPWTPETQRKYDRFIEEERKYVEEKKWDQFPLGSRLFVGNLSSERVTKRDMFHVFHHYGDLAQISIKQAYGFVQFFNAADCSRAIARENKRQIRGQEINLQISHPTKQPQRNRDQNQNNSRNRSRSPDHNRNRPSSHADRYVSGSRNGGRMDRDGYRPSQRSPSPQRVGYRERYDDRRHRSPSLPRYGRDPRAPSPRSMGMDNGLPLPPRQPRDVPEVQFLVFDNLQPNFIAWVEQAFSRMRVNVMFINPRMDKVKVVNQQIMEGVLAISKLTMENQVASNMNLTIFDRRGGSNSVQFQEYDKLDPQIACELALQARAQAAQTRIAQQQPNDRYYPADRATQFGYGTPSMPPPGFPQGYPAPPTPAAPAAPNLQNLDQAGLQYLLKVFGNQNGTPQATNAAPYGTPAPQYNPYAANPAAYGGGQQAPPMAALQSNPNAFAGYYQQQQQQPGQQPPQRAPQQAPQQQPQQQQFGGPGQVNVHDILAKLGNNKQ